MTFFHLEAQRKIYNVIEKQPGIDLAEIVSTLNMTISEVERHLREMEHDGLIAVIDKDGIKSYIIKEVVKLRDRRIIKTRNRIYTLIDNNPGIHLSRIAQLLNIRVSLAEYHLQFLEKEGSITILKEKGYKRYYTGTLKISVKDKKIVSIIRHKIPLTIISYLIKHPNARHKDIAGHLGLSTSALSYHLNKLVMHNIVYGPEIGNDQGYTIVDKNDTIRLIRRYRLHTLLERFSETWDDLK